MFQDQLYFRKLIGQMHCNKVLKKNSNRSIVKGFLKKYALDWFAIYTIVPDSINDSTKLSHSYCT